MGNTTVNIEDELKIELKIAAAKTNRTIGQIIDSALRSFLGLEKPDNKPDKSDKGSKK